MILKNDRGIFVPLHQKEITPQSAVNNDLLNAMQPCRCGTIPWANRTPRHCSESDPNTTNHFLSPTNLGYVLFKESESYKQEDKDHWPTFQVYERTTIYTYTSTNKNVIIRIRR